MKYIKYIFLFLLSCNIILAQEIVFKATVNKNKVALNDYIQITFSIENGNPQKFAPPDFSKFNVLSGPNQSSSMQIINGHVSQSISYSYLIQPKEEGQIIIGPAVFVSGGKNFESNSITIEAVKSVSSGQSGNTQNNNSQSSSGNELSDNVYIKAFVDKTNVYQGEQVTVTFKLFTRMSILNYSMTKTPSFTGFWTTDIEFPNELKVTQENVDGIVFNVGTIRKIALFPQRDGTLEIDPMEMEAAVRIKVQNQQRGRSIFDDFFGDSFFGMQYKDVKHLMKSNRIKINVKPLPQAGRPSDFNGTVGEFSLNGSLNQTSTETNEPLTYRITISGEGNLKLATDPVIELPKDFESFDPKISENFPKVVNPIKGSKTYEYLLVPRRPGTYKLPSVHFSYFDPNKRKYITLSTQEYTIDVEKGEGDITATSGSVTGISKEDVSLIGQDIRFIKTLTRLKNKNQYFFLSGKFFLFSILPIGFFILFFIFYKKQQKEKANVSSLRSRRANRLAKKRLKLAQKLMQENNTKQFYNEVVRALWGYISDRLKIQQSDLSKDNILSTLKDRNVNEVHSNELIRIIDTCEMAVYSTLSESSSMENIYQSSIKLISAIESDL